MGNTRGEIGLAENIIKLVLDVLSFLVGIHLEVARRQLEMLFWLSVRGLG